jgi:hypothetical protein
MKEDNKITGTVFRYVELDKGPSYTNPQEEVIELRLKSETDSNSSYNVVISKDLAKLLHKAFRYTK